MHPCIQRKNLTHKTRCTFQLEASHQALTHKKHQLHQLSQTPVTLKPPTRQLSRKNLHSPLVLSHKLGGEFAEDVQESQVEGRSSFSLGTRILKCKLDTIPERCTKTERKNNTLWAEKNNGFLGHRWYKLCCETHLSLGKLRFNRCTIWWGKTCIYHADRHEFLPMFNNF